MNQPLLMWVESCGGNTCVSGRLDVPASPLAYTIDFYSNTFCDATGMGGNHFPPGTTLSLQSPGGVTQHFRTTIPGHGGGGRDRCGCGMIRAFRVRFDRAQHADAFPTP